jgi:hypothetical protein
MIDPTSAIGKKQIQDNPQDIQKVKVGTIIKNDKGERMRFTKEGRWVTL